MTETSLVLLEFNELGPGLLDRWMAAGKLPNVKRFHDGSEVGLTEVDAKTPAREPWIQWSSMSTGVDDGTHEVFRLTDGSLNLAMTCGACCAPPVSRLSIAVA